MNILDLITDNLITIIGWVAGGIFCFLMLYARSKFVPKEDFDKLKSAFEDAVKRVDIIEFRLANFPTKEDVQELALQINSLQGELKSVSTKFEGFSGVLDMIKEQGNRMENFLKLRM